jgi:polar amino acid transport system substrate-binding protein
VPVLLLLYTLYFGLPALAKTLGLGVNISIPAFAVAVIVFGMNYAAYEAEIYRAGLGAIPAGQWEAAASLGMSKFTTFRRIILPQTFRIITPPVTNDFVAMLKDTSLVSTISLNDLTKEQLQVARSYTNYFETGIVAAILYLMMSVPLGYLARRLEKRWAQEA